MYIGTRGTISLKTVEASGTSDGGIASAWYGTPFAGSGLLAVNDGIESTGRIYISAGVFTGNADFGMRLLSNGAISLLGIDASSNGNIGAYVKNDLNEGKNGVSIRNVRGGWNNFNGNNGAGLLIETNGSVSMADIAASGNAMVTNTFASGGIGTASVQEFYNDALGADVWEFYAAAGVPLTIQLDSVWSPEGEVFDPLLELYGVGDVFIDSDDNFGGGLDAEINYTPSVAGWYYLHVSGLFGVDGGYALAINDPDFADLTE